MRERAGDLCGRSPSWRIVLTSGKLNRLSECGETYYALVYQVFTGLACDILNAGERKGDKRGSEGGDYQSKESAPRGSVTRLLILRYRTGAQRNREVYRDQ